MLEPKPQIIRNASYGIVLDSEQILLCRLSNEVADFSGYWTLPGGGLEFGEHPKEGMVREVLEETGLHVRPTNLLGVDSITRENPKASFQSIRIIYHTEVIGGSLRNEEKGTTDLCQWHSLEGVHNLETLELVNTALTMIEGKGGGKL